MSARSRGSGASMAHDFLYLLTIAPFWAGPILVVLSFSAFRWVIPSLFRLMATGNEPADTIASTLVGFSVQLSPWVGLAVGLLWMFAEIRKWVTGRQLDVQTGIESIKQLTWFQFELLLEEAFRRQGYRVENTGGSAPDGGVDLRLSKDSSLTLVQCKRWNRQRVSVNIVRELLGVVASEGADAGIVVTSGYFTPDAIDFARRNPIRLVGGDELARMIREVQSRPSNSAPIAISANDPSVPSCPLCSSPMKLRTARKGPNPGSQFWGCSRYPDCRGKRDVSAAARTA